MTVVIEGTKSFFLADRARILDDSRDTAWAEKFVRPNPAHKWILGKYVEANKANSNKQLWALDDLRMAQPSIQHAPMNMLHHPRSVVGAFVATELVYPVNQTDSAAYEYENPFVEALGVFWNYYFPDEYKVVEAAHASGSLFFSMECVAESILCTGEGGCGTEFAYDGPRSETYCDHLNEGQSDKQLNKPHFLAGALIIPPERPGWKGAEIKDISSLVKEHKAECEMAYDGVSSETPHLSPAQWEYLMAAIVGRAKQSS